MLFALETLFKNALSSENIHDFLVQGVYYAGMFLILTWSSPEGWFGVETFVGCMNASIALMAMYKPNWF